MSQTYPQNRMTAILKIPKQVKCTPNRMNANQKKLNAVNSTASNSETYRISGRNFPKIKYTAQISL